MTTTIVMSLTLKSKANREEREEKKKKKRKEGMKRERGKEGSPERESDYKHE